MTAIHCCWVAFDNRNGFDLWP